MNHLIFRQLAALIAVAIFGVTACAPKSYHGSYHENTRSTIVVDSLINPDLEVQSIIAPYKRKLDKEMDSVVGYAAKELIKGPGESTLGNFVADIIQEKADVYYTGSVDMGSITIGGLRIPIPEGPVRLGDVYELMPFENMIWVLELTGEQTKQLFEYAARRKNIAISNTRLVVQEGEPVEIFINGEAFNENRTYTLAISDYLASGGDNLFFLLNAKVVAKLDIKLRDIILEKITDLTEQDKKIDANIEGRIVEQSKEVN